MDPRLDPACGNARELTRRHRDQEALLVAGSGGQLASVVRGTQEKQVREHLVACARCRHYEPRCARCGFDGRRERHGWMCPAQASRWRDLLPWNWRPRRAPAPAKAPPWRHVTTPTPPRPPRPAPAAAPAPAPPPAKARAAPKPRPRPQAPAPSALALAYAALGLAPEATPEAVRSAYRQRALQYHPDKVASMGPELREVAERKMTEINAAYERIKRSWS